MLKDYGGVVVNLNELNEGFEMMKAKGKMVTKKDLSDFKKKDKKDDMKMVKDVMKKKKK
jgi:hypothetical protein